MAKFETIQEFYESLAPEPAAAIRRLVEYVAAAYPQLELALAWNQPMFRIGTNYFIGFMPTKAYINLATVSPASIVELAPELAGYRHGGRTISLPFDWQIDPDLIAKVIAIRARELEINL